MSTPNNIVLLHGKGGSPAGTVRLLEAALRRTLQTAHFVRPLLPHCDPDVVASISLDFLRQQELPERTAIIGVSLGGLVAAKLQECGRSDLRVLALSSPTWADDVKLEHRSAQRVALYSSLDGVIAGRTADWPRFATAIELPWLTHDTDAHIHRLLKPLAAFISDREVRP